MSVHGLPGRQDHERSLELAATAVDFELTRAESAELEAHLAGCPTCARRAAAMRGDAVALGRPLILLPSARVDAAIAAEIAGRRSGPQRLVLVAAAALLALALLGAAVVGAYVLRNATTAPITEVTPTTPPAIASPAPSGPPVPIGETWGTIDFAPDSGGSMEAVVFNGTDLLGVGGGGCVPVGEAPTQCYGGAWTAPPGERWTRVPDQPGLEVGPALGTSDPQAGIFDAAAGRSGTVAIGYADDGRARVWRSTDGQTWERTEFDPGSSTVVLRLAAIETSPDGFVIVGRAVDNQTSKARAAAWISPDGITWTRAQDTAEMDVGLCFEESGGPSCGGMTGVVATESGFVAVGSDHARAAGTEPGRPAAWTSPDGRTWTQANVGLDFVGALSDVEVGGPGLVAVGSICPPDCHSPLAGAVSATSVDGSMWSFNKVDGAVGGQQLKSVGGRVFALGVLYRDTDPAAELELWQTDDGVAWQRVTTLPPTTDAQGGADIAVADGHLIIAGSRSVTGVDGVTNFAYASPPLAPASTPDASTQPDASLGVSSDPWRTVGIPASDIGTDWIGLMKAVAPTESGSVAVGLPVCAPQDQPTTCHTSVWTAAPGENWTRAPDQPGLRVSTVFPTSGPSPGMLDVTAGPAGLVAIGYDMDPQARGPAVWRSTDGRTWSRVDSPFGSKPAEQLDQRITAVAADRRGYVIVGFVIESSGDPPDINARAIAWTSTDGVAWSRAADTADMDVGACVDTGEEPGCGGMLAVTATDTGYIAVGQAAPGAAAGQRPAAWTSTNGIDWVRIDAGLGFNGRLNAVASGANRVVATGLLCTGSQCSAVDAVTSDHVTWKFAAVAGTPSEGSALTSQGDAVVGMAWNVDDGTHQVWRTTDGLTRESIEAFPLPAGFRDFESADIAASGERIVVVGWVNVTSPPETAFGPTNVSFQSP